MTRLLRVFARLRALGRGGALDRDLQEEIASHLDEAAEEFERQGLPRAEARQAAMRSFGGIVRAQEAHRDVRSFRALDDARRDLHYAIRALRRAPGFTLVAIATLAVTSGAATAIFSVIDAALLRPLPYERPEEIVSIDVGESYETRLAPSAADMERWRPLPVFTHVGMGRLTGFRRVLVDAGTPERLAVGSASEDFLEVFGISPLAGRAFTADDRRPGAALVLLIGHRYWQTRFAGAADIVGRSMRVDGTVGTIVGVLPPGFYPGTLVWRPHVVPAPMTAMRGTGVPVYARLRPGLDATAAARALSASVTPADGPKAAQVWVTSLYDVTTRNYPRTIAVLAGAVLLVVLIACINVAGLLLARGTMRQAELIVRAALGASRGRLVRQLMTESILLAAAGAILGVVLAFLTLDAIVTLVPLSLPANVTPAVNLPVLAFALALTAITAMAFGLVPALTLSRTGAAGRVAAGRMRHGSALTKRRGQALIAIEVALALVLVTGAGLMIRSFSKILAIDVGFDPSAIVTMEVVPVDSDAEAVQAYYTALVERVRQVPGVEAAGAADRAPLDGSGSYTSVTVDGESIGLAQRQVMPGYFEALGLPLLQGRLPTVADYHAAPKFAVLSASAARILFPNRSAVGRQLVQRDGTWTVVGVVGDARNRSPLPEPGRLQSPDVYFAYDVNARSPFGPGLTVVVRPAVHTPALAEELRRAAHALGPTVIVEEMRSGRDWFGERVATPRQQTTLLGLFGGLALTLTLVGIFATTAYAVARRAREVGIRMALGARPDQMVGAIVRDAAWPVALGIAVGLAGAAAATRTIAAFLFETPPTDALTFTATAAVLAATALLAAWVPARRAAHVHPAAALQAD